MAKLNNDATELTLAELALVSGGTDWREVRQAAVLGGIAGAGTGAAAGFSGGFGVGAVPGALAGAAIGAGTGAIGSWASQRWFGPAVEAEYRRR